MGGKNHQPCGSYLSNSTKMSRSMSLAFVSLELANVSLEDVILAELEGKLGDISPIIVHLEQSGDYLLQMRASLDDLCQQMEDMPFQDLPTLQSTNLSKFGELVTEEGLHQSNSDWKVVADCMRERGFWGMTDVFKDSIAKLHDLTAQLRTKVECCRNLAKNGTVHIALEENNNMNFKAEFARVYTTWATFQQQFLASSLISTELWYRFNQFGSILQQPEEIHAVA